MRKYRCMENQGVTEVITRADRLKCFKSRDLYFSCKIRYEDEPKYCEEFEKNYYKSCPKSWIAFFNNNSEKLGF